MIYEWIEKGKSYLNEKLDSVQVLIWAIAISYIVFILCN